LPSGTESEFATPYGRRCIVRNDGDTLQPDLLSRDKLELLRRGMTDYNFAAQYQQNPQPPSGNVVKREWLKYYDPSERPTKFELVIQSWDTANKNTELANLSACTTWGLKDHRMYLLDVFHRKLDFPNLKRAVKDQILLHSPTVVLIEDRASGTSLIQELRSDGVSIVEAAPSIDGDKVMRLRGQTAKIEGGFVLFRKRHHGLTITFSSCLLSRISSHDDRVDSTVYALAWIAQNPRWRGNLIKPAWIRYYTALPRDQRYKRVFLSWDTAVQDGGQSDRTVCTAWMRLGGIYYLLDVERGIYEYPELRKVFIDLVQKHDPEQIQIEETEIGIALKDDRGLPRRSSIKLQPIEQDRKGRLYTQQIMFKDGTVQFPKHASFMPQVEKELFSHPYGQTDDIVDSISLALKHGATGYDTTLSWVG
jgi:predicted phage terminase large subunit-like protein